MENSLCILDQCINLISEGNLSRSPTSSSPQAVPYSLWQELCHMPMGKTIKGQRNGIIVIGFNSFHGVRDGSSILPNMGELSRVYFTKGGSFRKKRIALSRQLY